jgi:MFS family permease
LSPSGTTAIFAAFPVALVVVLALFGDVADYIGRRRTIQIGLIALLASGVLFIIAPTVEFTYAARVFTGIGVAFTMGPASAAMVEFSPLGLARQRASAVTTAATATGLALAVLISGVLIDFAPLPTHLSFAIFSVAVVGVLIASLRLPRHTSAEANGRWRPRGVRIPKELRFTFVAGALSVTAGFTIGAIVLSLGADIARDLIGSSDALVGSSVIALFAVVMGAAAITARRLRPRTTTAAGAGAGLASLALLAVAAHLHSLPLLIIFAIIAGIAYALLFAGGLALINGFAPAHHRAGLISATYLLAYLAQGVAAFTLGLIATASTLELAVDVGALAIAVIVIVSFVVSRRHPH